jgi:hypothetical protein
MWFMTICIWKNSIYALFRIHWKPIKKRLRVELSREILRILEQDQQHEFEHILTGEESWFFLNIFIVRAGPQIQMTCLKFPSKKFNPKSASFRLSGAAQGSKVCCIF